MGLPSPQDENGLSEPECEAALQGLQVASLDPAKVLTQGAELYGTMPPRKKARLSVGPVGATGSGGEVAVASSMQAVTDFQKDVAATIELMYSLRHGTSESLKRPFDDFTVSGASHGSPTLPAPDESGEYPFPICGGGTFLDMVRRAQQNKQWLLTESALLCQAVGLLKTGDPDSFEQEFVSAKEPWTIRPVPCYVALRLFGNG